MSKKDTFVEEVSEIMAENDYLEEIAVENKTLVTLASKIQDPVLKPTQIVALLAKTPAKYKYKRPGKGGSNWEYVSGGYIKKRLNQIFGWRWSFSIVDKFKDEGEVVVQGKLVILDNLGNPMIVKEDFGKKEILCSRGTTKALSIGNDYKSAATDALKRCAFQLGLASDVYAPQEYKELENPTEAIYSEETTAAQYQVTCTVCSKNFYTDKKFMKECIECYKLPKATKVEKKQKPNEEEPFKS